MPSNRLFFPGSGTAAITRNERYPLILCDLFLFQTAVVGFIIFYTLS